jgi:hypothetical protein
MTLQEAIRIIAIYDGWRLEFREINCCVKDRQFKHYDELKYSTSADALLPVWRKVRSETTNEYLEDRKWNSNPTRCYDKYSKKLDDILYKIAYEDYEQACIELAGIIQQMSS